MKKKLLFVIPSLEIGGAEKSLVNLLTALDYQLYEIDLLLLSRQNELLKDIPKNVNVIFPGENYFIFTSGIFSAMMKFLFKGNFGLLSYRLLYSIYLKVYAKNKNKAEQYSWKFLRKSIGLENKIYEAAIGYLEKTSIYLVVDSVCAKKKIGFIRANYEFFNLDKTFDSKYFAKLDALCANGLKSLEILKKNFASHNINIQLVYNITPVKKIMEMSKEQTGFEKSEIDIISVGRLHPQKGYDLSIETSKILKERNFDFKWYVLGEGSQRSTLEKKIVESSVQENFILLGAKDNPYSYIRQCDIFVQSSLYEGRSNTLIEAKLLCKPIIVTNFESASELIENGTNGFICERNAKELADQITSIAKDVEVRNLLVRNLKEEMKTVESSLHVFLQLIN
ncbi:glycosyltransferase [Chryseobacterium sp. R2A-55]|uniref:glycosyltransferase n=1 Tax=Chryseobacterium sp. R2A-55 TaxID=2744445 RepID=UPI001F18B37D|nr:glycosyltransferase [Chryseobacterium sp. R2A-55]